MPDTESVQFEVWLYNADNTGYRILPLAGEDSPGVADGTTGRVTADSGYAEVTLSLLGQQSDFPDLLTGRRVEFYARYTSRYTGLPRIDMLHQAQVDRVMPVIDSGLPYLRVTLIGLWADTGKQICKKRYALANTSDKSVIFGDLASRFVAKGRLADVSVQAIPVGADIIYYDAYGDNGVGVTFSKASADLAQNVGAVATGGDVSPVGARRVFFRPFDDLTLPARHTLFLPDKRIGQTRREQDVTGQATVLTIVGAGAYYPNLVASSVAGNTTFNNPLVPGDSDAGNLVTDGSFEAQVGNHYEDWSMNSGASLKQESDEGVTPFNGSYYLELDHSAPSENAFQVKNPLPTAPTAGAIYVLDCRARVSNGSKIATGQVVMQPLSAGGAAVGAAINLLLTPTLATGTTWTLFSIAFAWPSGAVGASLRPECTYQSVTNDESYALLVDEVRLYNADGLTQNGWQSVALAPSVFSLLNWNYEADAWIGGSCVEVSVTAEDENGHDARIEPLGAARFAVRGGQSIVGGFVVKAAPGSSILVRPNLDEWENDGSFSGYVFEDYTVDSTDWIVVAVLKNFNESAAQGYLNLTFRGSGTLYIGAAFAFDAGKLPSGYTSITQIVDPAHPEQFCEGASFVTTVRADTLFAAGTPIYEAAESLGDIPAQEQHDEITCQADADTYGIAFFQRYVPVLERPDIESWGVFETGDPDPVTGAVPSTATMMPGESIRVLGADAALLMPNPLPCFEKSWTWSGGKLTITPYANADPRDPSRTLVSFVRKLMAQGLIPSSGGSSSTSANYYGSGGSSSSGVTLLNGISGSLSITGTGTVGGVFASATGTTITIATSGVMATNVRAITANTTLSDTDSVIQVDCTSGNIVGTLPLAASCYTAAIGGNPAVGQIIEYVRADSTGNTMSAATQGSDVIDVLDGTTTEVTANPGSMSMRFVANSAASWRLLSEADTVTI